MPKLTNADVRAVLGMAPQDVVGYFERKGFVLSWQWQDVVDERHAHVFTVAKVTKLDVLQSIYDALLHAVNDGQTFAQFKAELTPILQSKGWWGKAIDPDTGEIIPAHSGTTAPAPAQLGSASRLWTIYQTNMQSAFMAGRYKAMMGATDTHPYWRYTAIRDRRTRATHAALDGRVYRFDDPFWSYYYPPWAWLCRCRVSPVSTDMFEREKMDLRSSLAEPIKVDEVSVGGDPARVAKQATFTTVIDGKKVAVKTAPGFAFNPGREAWQPETNRWRGPVADLAKQMLPTP
jgi:SPP1 gp7 family putative phage head morphogenesis protein